MGDPAGFAADRDWQQGLTVWALAGGVPSPGLTASCSSMSCRAGQPASGRRRPRHATGGGDRAALEHSAQPGPAPSRLSSDLRIPRTPAELRVITAAGISAGMEMGLHLLRRAGHDEAFIDDVARVMEYTKAYEAYREDREMAARPGR